MSDDQYWADMIADRNYERDRIETIDAGGLMPRPGHRFVRLADPMRQPKVTFHKGRGKESKS